MGEKRGMQALEAWCKRVTSGYAGVNVTNMTSSWRDGLAFCALIHHFRPDLIDFASLSSANIYQNNELAFTVAEQHLGIPALLDPEDMVKCSIPDRLSILTYLSQFYQVLGSPKAKGVSPLIGSVKRPVDSTSFDAPSAGGTPVKIFARQFQDAASSSGRRLDLCVVCQNAVFLAERLIVNSKLHHRTCFRCARCTSQLSVANYYETEKGQYCCETCPDEVEQHKETASTSITTAVVVNDGDLKKEDHASPEQSIAHDSVVPAEEQNSATPSATDMSSPERESGAAEQMNDDSPEAAPLSISSSTSEKVDHDESQPSTTFLPENMSFTQQRTMELKKHFFQSLNDPAVDVDSHEATRNVEIPQEVEPVEDGSVCQDDRVIGQTVPPIPEEVLEPATEENAAEAVAPDSSQVAHVPKDDVQVLDVSTCSSVDRVKDVENDRPEIVPLESVIPECTVVEESADEITSQSDTEARDEPQSEVIAQVETHEDADATSLVGQSPDSSIVVPKPRRRSRRSTDDSVTSPSSQVQIRVEAASQNEYPENLNPFDDDDEEEPSRTEAVKEASPLNPFGSDEEDDQDQEVEIREKKVIPAPRVSLNPFGSDDEDEEQNSSSRRTSTSTVPKQPKPERPPLPSNFDRTSSSRSLGTYPSPRRADAIKSAGPSPSPTKKRHAPPPPPLKCESKVTTVSPTPQFSSLRRKEKPAPPPPCPIPESDIAKSPDLNRSGAQSSSPRDSGVSSLLSPMTDEFRSSLEGPTPTPAPRTLLPVSPMPKPRLLKPESALDSESDVVLREKSEKEISNLTVQCSINKDTHGQWKRKKGPAPPRPLPQKRQLRKLPVKHIQQELEDIEVKQLELERQGVALEQSIRSMTDPEDSGDRSTSSIEVEEQILQLFDLVNEKNDLLRRQTELMYIRRQQRLEEEHAELEFQIRCLMEKPSGEKTDEDRLREEELIQRLVQVVHRRSEIVDCLEMDRRREVEEDQSIQQHLEVFNSRSPAVSPDPGTDGKPKSKTLKMIQSPIKLIKKDKQKKSKKKVEDADKDIDESESKTSLAHSSTPGPLAASAAAQGQKEKDKDKKKSKLWFTK